MKYSMIFSSRSNFSPLRCCAERGHKIDFRVIVPNCYVRRKFLEVFLIMIYFRIESSENIAPEQQYTYIVCMGGLRGLHNNIYIVDIGATIYDCSVLHSSICLYAF